VIESTTINITIKVTKKVTKVIETLIIKVTKKYKYNRSNNIKKLIFNK
jgi:hypothetical protein